jgi:hypothetical protein
MVLSQVHHRHGTRNVPNTTSSQQQLGLVCEKMAEGVVLARQEDWEVTHVSEADVETT